MRAQYEDVIAQLVVEGRGVAVLSEAVARAHVDRGNLIAFELELPVAYRMLHWRAGAPTGERRAALTSLRRALAR